MPDETILPYWQTIRLLQQYSIPIARQELVQTPAQAVNAAQRIGLPVAIKAISAAQSHKTEAGLISLNLTSTEAVEMSAARLIQKSSGAKLEGLLVQEMVTNGIEMIAGISRDIQFGPVIVVGSGGILVELLQDVAMSVPPLTSSQALDMLQQTHGWKLLNGFRGHLTCDIPALQGLVVNLSRMALECAEQVRSLDLNPVMVLPGGQGVKVVDARISGIAGKG